MVRLRFVSILGLLIFSSCHHYAVIAAESGIMLREVPYSFRLVVEMPRINITMVGLWREM